MSPISRIPVPVVVPAPTVTASWTPVSALPRGRRPVPCAPGDHDLRRRLTAYYRRRLREDARRKARAVLPS